MIQIGKLTTENTEEFYKEMKSYLKSLIGEESDWLANLSNAAAIVFSVMPDINWAGFYLYKKGELVLGPFQGKPACIRIALGKGVCGVAAKSREIQIVKDVNEFPGHIACDSASRSELVIPIIHEEKLIGVLDIDSPIEARFGQKDAEGLTAFTDILNQYVKWPDFE